MIKSKLKKKVQRLVFVQHLSVAASAMWIFLCTQNEFVQVKIVSNFSIQLYWGIGRILQDLKSYKAYYKSTLKGTHDVRLFASLFSKRAKIWNDCRISDCAAAQ